MSTRVPMRGTGTEQAVVVEKDRNGSGAKGLPHRAGAGAATAGGNTGGRTVQATAKPLPISKRQVWEAYRQVKANGGAAGIDGQTVEAFDEDMANNLYKLWNRLASGSYMPPAVKRVDIPKAGGGTRPLGVPTVADRIAQTVIRQIGIGGSPLGCTPATPPGMRVRTGRFERTFRMMPDGAGQDCRTMTGSARC